MYHSMPVSNVCRTSCMQCIGSNLYTCIGSASLIGYYISSEVGDNDQTRDVGRKVYRQKNRTENTNNTGLRSPLFFRPSSVNGPASDDGTYGTVSPTPT